MNIVYGGSFNPPSLAHKEIIESLIEKFNPDNFIVVPVGNIYSKPGLLDFDTRSEMIKIMMKDCVIISDYEKDKIKYEGTLKTLEYLNKIYDDIYFVMGRDNLLDIENWINYKKLISKYKFIIINRDNLEIPDIINKYKENFIFIEMNNIISSTLIRSDVKKYKDYLDIEVYEYIVKNNLY